MASSHASLLRCRNWKDFRPAGLKVSVLQCGVPKTLAFVFGLLCVLKSVFSGRTAQKEVTVHLRVSATRASVGRPDSWMKTHSHAEGRGVDVKFEG